MVSTRVCGTLSFGSNPSIYPISSSQIKHLLNLKFIKGMKKRVISMFKRAGKAYLKGMCELYGPAFNCGLHPWI